MSTPSKFYQNHRISTQKRYFSASETTKSLHKSVQYCCVRPQSRLASYYRNFQDHSALCRSILSNHTLLKTRKPYRNRVIRAFITIKMQQISTTPRGNNKPYREEKAVRKTENPRKSSKALPNIIKRP